MSIKRRIRQGRRQRSNLIRMFVFTSIRAADSRNSGRSAQLITPKHDLRAHRTLNSRTTRPVTTALSIHRVMERRRKRVPTTAPPCTQDYRFSHSLTECTRRQSALAEFIQPHPIFSLSAMWNREEGRSGSSANFHPPPPTFIQANTTPN